MTGAFLAVRCGSCDNEQTVFERASTLVRCGGCGEPLAEPTGGTAAVRGEVLGVVERR